MKNYINEFVENMNKKELSNNTIDAYKRDVKKFSDFIQEREEHFLNVDMVSIMAYVQMLKKEGRANSSIIRNLVSIKSFYRYLVKERTISENPVMDFEMPKNKRNLPEILTVEEVDKLLCTPDCTEYKGVRDKAMLELMYATGMKVSEILSLSVFDVNLKLAYIKCKGLKGKERIIPIGSYAVNCIRDYLNIRDEVNGGKTQFLFCNMRGQKMTRQGFWKIVKNYAKEANINKKINLYTLRHSFAVHLLQNGADMRSVQELLGHNTIATTQIYSSISKQNKIVDIYKKAHPRA